LREDAAILGWNGTILGSRKRPVSHPIRPFPEYNLGDAFLEIKQGDRLPSGGNVVIRHETLRCVGEFSTDYGPRGHDLKGGEDQEFLSRALSAGARILYFPAMVQFHYVDPARMSIGYLLRKSYLRSQGDVVPGKNGERLFRLYMVRKCLSHLSKTIFTLQGSRRRYYLVRLAASWGELTAALRHELKRRT